MAAWSTRTTLPAAAPDGCRLGYTAIGHDLAVANGGGSCGQTGYAYDLVTQTWASLSWLTGGTRDWPAAITANGTVFGTGDTPDNANGVLARWDRP